MQRRARFTLIEIMVALAVFAVLMASLMQFFSSAQKIWTTSSSKTEMFENARLALDMITRDLQSTYYSDQHSPFYVDYATNTLSMISYTNNIPTGATSRICLVQYHLNSTDNKLYTYVIANNSGNWNIVYPLGTATSFDGTAYLTSGSRGANDIRCFIDPSQTWSETAITATGEYMSPITPCVVGFYMTCYGQSSVGSPTITPLCTNDPTCNFPSLSGTSGTAKFDQTNGHNLTTDASSNPVVNAAAYPYAVQITLQLMSKTNYAVWKSLPSGAQQDTYKVQHAVNFNKMAVIGNRGQYE